MSFSKFFMFMADFLKSNIFSYKQQSLLFFFFEKFPFQNVDFFLLRFGNELSLHSRKTNKITTFLISDEHSAEARYDFYRLCRVHLKTDEHVRVFQELEAKSDSFTFYGHARAPDQKLTIMVAAHKIAEYLDILSRYKIHAEVLVCAYCLHFCGVHKFFYLRMPAHVYFCVCLLFMRYREILDFQCLCGGAWTYNP